MICPCCDAELVPGPDAEDALARVLWSWNADFFSVRGFPYDRLTEPTREDLRELARALMAALTARGTTT